MHDPYNLERFVGAQDPIYDLVLSELRRGQKRDHWMWFIFPQMRGLGRSPHAVTFSISGRAEAEAYLKHATLGHRLHECTAMVMKTDARSISEIFSYPDDLKFRSSMTLFDCIKPGVIFGLALKRFFADQGDQATLDALRG